MEGKYNGFLRILHWAMALLIICMIFLGWFMEDVVEKNNPIRSDLFNLHKSLGVTILILVAIRIIIRFSTFVPPLPLSLPPFIREAARLSHYGLYVLMVAIPVTGYGMTNSAGYGVKLFGLPLPKVFPTDKGNGEIFRNLHGIFAYTMLGLVILHIVAAFKHHFFDKKENDVLPRII